MKRPYRLDNTAKLNPAVLKKTNTCVFRVLAIIRTIAVMASTLAVCSMLMGYIANTMDFNHQKETQIELDDLMAQVENKTLDLDAMSDEEYMGVAYTVCGLVDKIGKVTKAAHYFRNCFTRAPGTLDEMLEIIRHKQGGTFGWKLVNRQSTRFHMFGKNGEYNMKFISEDGHFEAIYNIEGVKLTGENNPMNMGTFNYGDPINEKLSHIVYDILPFFEWGNIQKSVKQVHGLPDEPHTIEITDSAVKRFEKYWKLLYGGKTREISGSERDLWNIIFLLCFSVALLAFSRSRVIHTGRQCRQH